MILIVFYIVCALLLLGLVKALESLAEEQYKNWAQKEKDKELYRQFLQSQIDKNSR